MGKLIKEAIIILLMCLGAILILAIGLYKFIPSRKVVPEIQKYSATEEVEEIKAESEEKEQDVITTYDSTELKVTSSDLDGYKITNDYVPGKSNPFEEYTGNPTTENPDGVANSGENTTEKNTNITTKEPAVYSSSSGTK